MPANLSGCTAGKHLAMIEDGDVIAVFRFLHKMGGDDYGYAFFGQRSDAPPEFTPRQRIGATRRFVQNKISGSCSSAAAIASLCL